MVAEMSYTSVATVVESWEAIRRMPNYEEVAGVMLFRRFFVMDSSAMLVFSFAKDTELNDEFFKHPKLVRHAKNFIQMIERSIDLLGPDIELLTEVLLELGEKHVQYGVKSSHYPTMGQALLKTVEELLGDRFTQDVKDAWLEIFQALSYDMIRARNR